MGAGGVWVLEKDPKLANPANPVQYMLDHGLFIYPNPDPKERFEFPSYGLPGNGLWFMSETVNTACIVEVT